MEQLARRLTTHLLKQKRWGSRIRVNAFVTTFFLFENERDHELHFAAVDALDNGNYQIDGHLLSDIYSACPKNLRVELAGTSIFGRIPRACFWPIFQDAYKRSFRVNVLGRRDLALTLEMFLRHHPGESQKARKFILNYLHSNEEELRLRGLFMMGWLHKLTDTDMNRVMKSLSARSLERINALNGLTAQMNRSRPDRSIVARLTHKNFQKSLDALFRSDPDENVRLAAKYLVSALNRHGQAAARIK